MNFNNKGAVSRNTAPILTSKTQEHIQFTSGFFCLINYLWDTMAILSDQLFMGYYGELLLKHYLTTKTLQSNPLTKEGE